MKKRTKELEQDIIDITNDFTMHYLDGGSAIEEFGAYPDLWSIDWNRIEKNLQCHYDLEDFKFNQYEKAQIMHSIELEIEEELDWQPCSIIDPNNPVKLIGDDAWGYGIVTPEGVVRDEDGVLGEIDRDYYEEEDTPFDEWDFYDSYSVVNEELLIK